jgi:hypothetical protein
MSIVESFKVLINQCLIDVINLIKITKYFFNISKIIRCLYFIVYIFLKIITERFLKANQFDNLQLTVQKYNLKRYL